MGDLQLVTSLISGLAQHGASRKKHLILKAAMHLVSYLLIAALILMGVEVIYAFYQLVGLYL